MPCKSLMDPLQEPLYSWMLKRSRAFIHLLRSLVDPKPLKHPLNRLSKGPEILERLGEFSNPPTQPKGPVGASFVSSRWFWSVQG